jgi:hypothetical protein
VTIVTIPSVAQGAAPDAMPEELANGFWSTVLNCTFRNGYLQRCEGNEAFVDAPSVTPYFLLPFRNGTQLGLIHVGLQDAFIDLGGTRTEIGRASNYTGGAGDRWTGGIFNGIAVINNGVDVPQFWAGSTGSDFADLTNWPAGYTCRAMRPFKNFLIAMDLTQAGTRYPSRVLWSAIADTGAVPPSWDITNPAREAGNADIEGGDVIVDGLTLGDSFIVYKSSAAFSMRYVGGQSVMAIQRIPGSFGLLARGCVADTPVGHVCLTTGDVVVHTGGAARSIATDVVRDTLVAEMDPDYYERSFVVANPAQSEVWVCYPTSGPTCKKAAVWNWRLNVWSFRTLRDVLHGAHGQMPAPDGLTCDELVGTCDSLEGDLGGTATSPNDQKLVLAHLLPAITMVGYGTTDAGLDMTAEATRIGMALDDAGAVKLMTEVWPIFDAAAGTEIEVTAGAAMAPNVAPTYGDAQTFTVGTDAKVNVLSAGRYLALRYRTTDGAAWRTRSTRINVEQMGSY